MKRMRALVLIVVVMVAAMLITAIALAHFRGAG